ncbi:hypothetical protein [Streptomyces sp. YS415]|uniref:hypothetical protein n=1 Tax=Streptomyces sp. YS415 TaxID=2944806 RepID=UPI002022444E|nr:hypothetical protein [Streptomyces sp. YS415]MCL7430525.1 hypothetical protein [Streptomyces sp. YS415]
MSSALEHPMTQAFVDPYSVHPAEIAWPDWPAPTVPEHHGDYLLPPPRPAERLSTPITPRDQRRLALHAVLTTAGIPPRPEDRDAIDQLAALPASINTTLQRWLQHTP